MRKAKHNCYFYLTDAQRNTITRMFRAMYETQRHAFGNEFDSILKRMPVIMKRIGVILTGLRLDMTKPLPERVLCSEDDFETRLLIGHKLLMHSAMMFHMLPENKDATLGEIGHTLVKKQFLSHIRSNESYFEMLPADFLSRPRTRTIAPPSKTP